MVGALFDTNILIDYLNGLEPAKKELDLYPDKAISLVTWMEVMAGATEDEESATTLFLGTFINLPITPAVAERAVTLRKTLKVKLPDAIILATAQLEGRVFVTRNTRDFKPDDVAVVVPYRL